MTQNMVMLSPFHVPLLRPQNYEYTWQEHGGLGGHIDYQERLKRVQNRFLADQHFIQYVVEHPAEFPTLPRYIDDFVKLSENFGGTEKVFDACFEPFLITGFSRSGGTYLQHECAAMKNFNIREEHIHFCHDYFPKDLFRAAFDYREMLTDLHTLFATFITYSRIHGRKYFFFRTVLGGLFVPYMEAIAPLAPGMQLGWIHIIRDMHGVYKSLKKYFSAENRSLDEFGEHKNFGSTSWFATDFGNVMIRWFMCNTTLLPSRRGLPFWDIRIDGQQPGSRIIDDIRLAVDNYLAANRHIGYYRLGRPTIIKFGSTTEEQCREAGKRYAIDPNYRPSTFNFRPVPEIDDRYSRVYDALVQELTRLYQAFDLAFDGRLERV